MTRVVVTGVGCISAAGVGPEALTAVLRRDEPLGRIESVETLRGRRRELRMARAGRVDGEAFLPASKLRRMNEVSQVWTIACLQARADARLDSPAAGCPPEGRGVFVGTGFGCIDTTWEYLEGLFRDGAGMANPFLFSESLANAPAGHSAIELDARGAGATFTCGDASAAAAVAAGARAIRDGRLQLAYCGGVELLPAPLLRVLAGIGAPEFLGEGCACLVLESLDSARARGAVVYSEVTGSALGSDPACPATEWSRSSSPMASLMRRAVAQSGRTVGTVFLHACGSPAAEAAERRAASSACPGAAVVCTSAVFGSLAAAGGFSLVASVLEPSGASLVLASSWGGSMFGIAFAGV